MSLDPLNILVLSTFDGGNATVIRDFLFSFNAHSSHRYYYVFDCAILDEDTDFSPFDVILIFWSVLLLGPDLTAAVRARIRSAPAVKILFLQDEYREVRATNAAMQGLGIQVLFTCVAEADHEIFYPPSRIPSLEATYTVLPGYVPQYLEGVRHQLERARPLDVGYRSRDVPFYLGDLGRQKRIIADRFHRICEGNGLRADISVEEADRLYGRAWVRFLRASRCVLGTASGASVVDFTGEIRRACERYTVIHPEATYEDVKARFFADVDGKVVIDTVSPRVFEAAALGTTMVHHEGRYAGILEPDRHYIAVKHDYSNVAEVVDRIRDSAFCRALAANAYDDLVASGRYSFRVFARWFDERLARHAPARARARPTSRRAFYARNYWRRQQAIIPRGGTFVVLPSLSLPFDLLRRGLARLPAFQRGPFLSRFIHNPMRVVRLGYAAARVVLRTPCLRALVVAYLRDAGMRAGVSAWHLAEDLMKIDIVRRARGGTLRARQPFAVGVEFDDDSGVLLLTSRDESGEPTPSRSPVPWEVERAILDGRVQLIVWDHTAVAYGIICEMWPGWWLPVGLGFGGVWRFDALSAVYSRSPGTTAPALLAILRGEDKGEPE